MGKSRAGVANAMRLLDLRPDVKVLVARGHLTVGHGKAILSIKDKDAQLLASDQILEEAQRPRCRKAGAVASIPPRSRMRPRSRRPPGRLQPGRTGRPPAGDQNKLRDRFATTC